MTISQLEYIVAVDKYRNFVKAAESCGVTQPTLSSMIQKLELELDIIIFDRSSHPVVSTTIGEKIINQAKVALYNVSQLKEIINSTKEQSQGEIKLAIIPTVAPYILPKLFQFLKESNPEISLQVSEMRTDIILEKLQLAEIDIAVLATPLSDSTHLEIPMYYEKFVAYVSPADSLYGEEKIDILAMPMDRLWILEEGHCLRNQIFNFCKRRENITTIYEAGSIDTLVKIVDTNGGYTIIPELHLEFLSDQQKKNLRPLSSPAPAREISLVVRQDFVRERMLNVLADAIKSIIPEQMLDTRLMKFAIRL